MSKRQLLCVLGVWIAVFLFLGFPSNWENGIALVSGLLILSIAYSLPAPVKMSDIQLKETFIENKEQ